MPRETRFVISGIAHHVIERGHNRGQPTGTPRFVDEIERKLGIRTERRDRGRPHRSRKSVPFLRPDLAGSGCGWVRWLAGAGAVQVRGARTRRVVLVVGSTSSSRSSAGYSRPSPYPSAPRSGMTS